VHQPKAKGQASAEDTHITQSWRGGERELWHNMVGNVWEWRSTNAGADGVACCLGCCQGQAVGTMAGLGCDSRLGLKLPLNAVLQAW
jgi:formylglycine-generating enzyme required for sulfatase activity